VGSFSNGYQLTDNIKINLLSPTPTKLANLAEEYEEDIQNTDLSGGDDDSSSKFSDLWNNRDVADASASNGASIAFLLACEGKSYAFLGDAHADVIVSSLKRLGYSEHNKLKLAYVKLSHHGSKYNVSKELLSLIECQNFFFSTSARASKETVAKIIKSQSKQVQILCNYNVPIQYFELRGDYKDEAVEFHLGDAFDD